MLRKLGDKIIAQSIVSGLADVETATESLLNDMAKKRILKPFRAVTAVKAMARDAVGAPPVTRRAPDKKKNTPKDRKHKATLGRLLTDGE